MLSRRSFLVAAAWLLAALVPAGVAQTAAKRPLNHHDYDGWKSISSQRLSPDGKWLAYGLFPQEGDGEVVIRNLATGQESRQPAGERPQPPASPDPEAATTEARGVTIAFSSDSRTLVFSTFPSRAEMEKARKDRKPADQMPREAIVIFDLASARATRIERVKRFQLPEKAAGYLAYLKEAPKTKPETAAPPEQKKQGDEADQQRGGRGGAAASGPRPEFGTDLVLRTVADGAERTFADVVEFSLSEDARQLVFAVSARDNARNGVFVADIASAAAPAALLADKGKYLKLAWDENQKELAFLSDRDDASAKQPKFKLYLWDRQAPAAGEVASLETPGFRKEFVISDKGNLSFSKDGSLLYFGCAPPLPEKKDDAAADTGDKASVDLWHWKDDYLQSVQKVRAERDRNRTYTAAYLIPEKKLVQLGDAELADITPSESPQWVLGVDDREYRRAVDYDERYADAYLVDAATGARRLVSRKGRGNLTWSPSGRYLLTFDGKDWNTISVPDGKTVNLTSALPAKFWNEDTDTPSTPGAYGSAGWTRDGRSVLLYDRFDVWRVAPDGSGAVN
ncbi:MAG: hypothetical protein LAQ30_24840, partial [Acidobacteriia bacterium]|nr:hypothetical protein [Terriglobia bacterium]